MIVPSFNPETIFVPSGEKATLRTKEPALTLSTSLRVPVASEKGVGGSRMGAVDETKKRAPESQTLIVPSYPLLTIFVPSGEKETELTPPLWTLPVSSTASSVSVME